MAAPPTTNFTTAMVGQPPRTVHGLINEETRAPPPVRLYPSQHRVSMTRYATSTDPRGYIPVFEYPLNGQYIMIDCETGMVHFTGIWKALGHTKADVVKLVESDPTIAPYLRKVRGGYLKIQGTWLPFETAQTLARRVAWQVRYDLIPLFGPEFPETCLGPGEPGFGQLLLSAPKPRGRRGAKKAAAAPSASGPERAAAPVSHDGHLGASGLQHQYSSGDPSRARAPARGDGVGPLGNYSSHQPSSRYSPYARAPSHGITQLEPLPNLLQPNQARFSAPTESWYNYQHAGKPPAMSMGHANGNVTSFPLVNHPNLSGSPSLNASPAASAAQASLPSMRNHPGNATHDNFFETYRGPDSFEALSNRWLASDTTTTASIPEPTLLTGENNCLPKTQYSGYEMPRKEGHEPSMHNYNHYTSLDSVPPGSQRSAQQPQAHSRGAGYPFDQSYESSFPPGVLSGSMERKTSGSPEYPAPHPTYDASMTAESLKTSQDCLRQTYQSSYVDSQTNSNRNATGSPSSHSSRNAGRSPSPSSASTSTHLHHSYHRPSQVSSHNTLVNLGNSNGSKQAADDVNQFSVLTSPAHLELEVAGGNLGRGVHESESEWGSIRKSSCISPPQTVYA